MPISQANTRRNTELFLLCFAAIPVLVLYAMYLMNSNVSVNAVTLAVPISLFAAFAAAHVAVRLFAPGADSAILPVVFVLAGTGITFVTRLNQDLAVGQIIWMFISVAAMVATIVLVRDVDAIIQYKFTIGIAGIALLLLPSILGTEIGGAKLWIVIGPFSFQPSEIAKVLVILFLGAYLAENREILSASSIQVGPLSFPRPRMLLPLVVMWGISLVVVISQHDLGSALLFFTFFILMLYVSTGRVGYVVFSLLLLLVGAVICYHVVYRVQTRVEIWLDPFADASNRGLQIVQSLYSLADGGLAGTGIGKGLCTYIPVVESDFIFSAIGEEMGLLGGSAILICYLLFGVRGFATAARAKSDVSAFIATGLTAAICFQAFLIVAGVTRLLPLTGVTLPFVSQGGSSLLASFIMVGLLLRAGDEGTGRSVQMRTATTGDQTEQTTTSRFSRTGNVATRVPVTTSRAQGHFGLLTPESGVLGRVALGNRLTKIITVAAVMFAVLIANLTYIQMIMADTYKNMPSNNHTIARSAYVQRGAIVTSDGVTLAESLQADDGSYYRNYPQYSLATHTVGYVSTRYGSTGVEASMNEALTGRSDYSTWQNALYSLAGVETPGSSVVLTINSQMQQAVESVLTGYTGAITILDPSTGAVLASASSPTFSNEDLESLMSSSDSSALLDRVTQALYEPGSTFKLVTLASALDTGTSSLDSTYSAEESIEIGGADVTNIDGESWSELSLSEALKYSANTVFGQVGTEVGASRLVAYADAFGYGTNLGQDFTTTASLMPDPDEMSEWETAWAACGQPVGQHESPAGPQTTVMQNAVMVAAIANNGIAMNPYVVDHILSPEGTTTSSTQSRLIGQVISAETASEVKEAMLGVVEDGTGVNAQVYGVDVAGKTGTAETGDDTSNSLFVGFAPYDSPTLAISICVEGEPGEDMTGVSAALAGEALADCLNIQVSGDIS